MPHWKSHFTAQFHFSKIVALVLSSSDIQLFFFLSFSSDSSVKLAPKPKKVKPPSPKPVKMGKLFLAYLILTILNWIKIVDLASLSRSTRFSILLVTIYPIWRISEAYHV